MKNCLGWMFCGNFSVLTVIDVLPAVVVLRSIYRGVTSNNNNNRTAQSTEEMSKPHNIQKHFFGEFLFFPKVRGGMDGESQIIGSGMEFQ